MTDIGCLVLTPGEVLLCADLYTKTPAGQCPVTVCQPSSGGQLYEIRPGSLSQGDWDAAIAAMNSTGGNVIRFLPGEHPGYYDARGSNHDPGPAQSGVSGNHNCVDGNSQNGAFFSGTGFSTVVANVDMRGVSYWDVHNVRVTSSSGFGLRFMSSGGDAGSRVQVSNIDIGNTEHARFIIGSWWSDQTVPSQFIDVHCPTLHTATGSGPNAWFEEGLYIGTGSPLGLDNTHDIRVYNAHIYGLTSDGIDLKPGIDNIEIYDSYIHDMNFVTGGPVAAISILDSWTGAVSQGDILIDGAVIHNVAGPTASSFFGPVSVGDGNVTIRNLVEWGNLADNAVRVRPYGTVTSGMTVNVTCSTAEGTLINVWDPDSANPTVNESCNIDGGDSAVTFVGPTSGTGDAGFGPGSGFVPLSGSGYNDSGGCCTTDIAGCPTSTPGAFSEAPAGI